MTWNQLAKEISLLTPDQQSTDVTVYVRGVDEFYPVRDRLSITNVKEKVAGGILDKNHPFLQV